MVAVIHLLLLGKCFSVGLPLVKRRHYRCRGHRSSIFPLNKHCIDSVFTIFKLHINYVLHSYPFEYCFFSYTLCFGWLYRYGFILGIAPVHFNCYVLFHMGKAYFINSLIDGYLDCLPFLVLWRIAQWTKVCLYQASRWLGPEVWAPSHFLLIDGCSLQWLNPFPHPESICSSFPHVLPNT